MADEELLRAKFVPYSSIVGGGLMLIKSPSGEPRFQIAIMGTTQGVTKEETAIISKFILEAINKANGPYLKVPARKT